jgi:O-antigen/teichoic acid export membrane protein
MWGDDDRQLATVARNVSTRYIAIILDALIGLVLLPFNVHHLGQSAYGLWMLTASLTTYFSVLDLGFGGSIVKFVAQYRAQRDVNGLNDIASTLFVIFSVMGIIAYGIFGLLALNISHVFSLSPEQLSTGRWLMLIIGVYVSLGLPFSIFGGIINGFQRYDLNNVVGVGSSVVVATVNVLMLLAGASLVQLVIVTTAIRIATYFVYRLNAYAVFPALRIRPSLFQWSRVRELTGFSVYISIIDWSNKLNYSIDAIVIGAFMSSAAVALWTVPQRLAEMLQRLTNQLNGVLFPVVVDSDAGGKPERLRAIFVQGTRLSLVSVVPMAAAMGLLADPLIRAWVGPKFVDSIIVAQILTCVVAIRVGNATATTVLKGAGHHRLLAYTNAGTALGHAGTGRAGGNFRVVAGGLPPRGHAGRRRIPSSRMADRLARGRDGGGRHPSSGRAARAAVGGCGDCGHRLDRLLRHVPGIGCEEYGSAPVYGESKRAAADASAAPGRSSRITQSLSTCGHQGPKERDERNHSRGGQGIAPERHDRRQAEVPAACRRQDARRTSDRSAAGCRHHGYRRSRRMPG